MANKAKTKVAEKVKKAKAKIARKCAKGCVALVVGLAALCGCQNPAQRAQTADTRITIFGGAVTFGNDFVSLAQSNDTGGNDSGQVASPTNDIKPDVNCNVGGASGGLLEKAAECVGGACHE